MHEEIRASRLRVTRRRALSIGGTLGLGGFLAACGGDGGGTTTVETSAGTTATVQPSTTAASDVVALLDRAATCTLAQEETQGPYWFDVDSIRSDVREDRPGTRLELALRVQDMSQCEAGGEAAPVANAVVEIWHCDAGGSYSGFESGAMGPPGDAGSGETSDGSYSQGDSEATTSDDGTYLRGAQATDRNGVAQFTTIYPGWYQGRTVHIHLKVHVDKRTVLTTQLYFDEALNDEVFATAPYDERGGRDMTNDSDGIFDPVGLLDVSREDDGYLGVINLGVNA
ncbi:intradiol ring-cleavage dioxygenase [Conexibacter stalactiti]|uniref:Intradiol ring-cleavage dioxygenase n=1 Tax=Conexibacter stalactiti TaxID=1940611 RepID=A0ABU4HJV7_9ACTN|nr:intradiol ring-cleavage dioxygenase [Conexibacter stalactiti]MDW5592835.1 intradiol ring-cleavage dioxygenase [Conexibacter stalactiti]MEC5033476.1 intradiol ring-cleavage dioxygenase [Conexibacter stalactiti]